MRRRICSGTVLPAWVSLAAAGWLVAGCSAGESAVAPTGSRPASTVPTSTDRLAYCVPPELASSTVAIKATAGGTIGAVLQGSGTTGIVFANMSDNDLCGWLGTASEHAARGYRTAVFAYSDRQGADADVLDVAAELRRAGALRIVLVGASKGGTAAIVAAGRVHPTAVVELSAPSDYEGMDAGAAVRTLTVPSLFIVGQDDAEFRGSTDALYAASPATVKHLKEVVSPAHGVALLPDPDVAGTIESFLAANAPAVTASPAR